MRVVPDRPDEHVPESGKVAVSEIVHLGNAPRIQPTSDLLPTHLDNGVATHYRKRDGVLDGDTHNVYTPSGNWTPHIKMGQTPLPNWMPHFKMGQELTLSFLLAAASSSSPTESGNW